eukprot:Amastigsp_a509598_547.p3 type:complete len:126 gc:universal Amastigsp_a509598_547:911-1288(+)
MERHRRVRLELLAVKRREHSHIVVGSRRRAHNSIVFVDHFQKLTDGQRHTLDALDLLLGTQELSLEVLLLDADVLFLNRNKLELALELLHARVQVVSRDCGQVDVGLERGCTQSLRGHDSDLLHL